MFVIIEIPIILFCFFPRSETHRAFMFMVIVTIEFSGVGLPSQ